MDLLAVITRKQGLDLAGKISYREAVRAIVLRDSTLLMIHATKNGDYKFPGGGVEPGETHETALKRELLEECGARLIDISAPFGKVIEYDLPENPENDVFMMTSYYYLCQVENDLETQNLELYERELGFTPEWLEIDTALQNNQALLEKGNMPEEPWIARETFILNLLSQKNNQPKDRS